MPIRSKLLLEDEDGCQPAAYTKPSKLIKVVKQELYTFLSKVYAVIEKYNTRNVLRPSDVVVTKYEAKHPLNKKESYIIHVIYCSSLTCQKLDLKRVHFNFVKI
jgi:hypothetical protein